MASPMAYCNFNACFCTGLQTMTFFFINSPPPFLPAVESQMFLAKDRACGVIIGRIVCPNDQIIQHKGLLGVGAKVIEVCYF